ncbi:hypothetical protein ABW21_db0202106 [Orbilia brochopaga]|nr:hypothetical protein ABW21_db0202106 [Drechslerella brochopaga]
MPNVSHVQPLDTGNESSDECEVYGIEDISLPRPSTVAEQPLGDITNRRQSSSRTSLLRILRRPAQSPPPPYELPWHDDHVQDAAIPGYTFCTLAGIAFETTNYWDAFIDPRTGRASSIAKTQAGGVGLYVVVGARMLLQGQRASNICWPMPPTDNPDFHKLWKHVTPLLNSTGVRIHWLIGIGKLTFTNFTGRMGTEARSIISQTNGTDILPGELDEKCLNSKVFHIFCGPTEAVYQIEKIHRLVKRIHPKKEPPIIVWQPDSEKCDKDTREDFLKASSLADVVTPLALDLARVFLDEIPSGFHRNVFRFMSAIEKAGKRVLNVFKPGTRNAGLRGMLVVRSGVAGAYIYGHPKSFQADPEVLAHQRVRSEVAMERRAQWVPTYYSDANRNSGMIQDPTGGEDAFVGAFCAYLAQVDEDYVEAAICGIVAMSFVVEQIAGASITISENSEELWNRQSFISRLTAYYKDCLRRPRVPRVMVPLGKPLRTVQEYIPLELHRRQGAPHLFTFRDIRNPIYGEEDSDDDSNSDTVAQARLQRMRELLLPDPTTREERELRERQRERELIVAFRRVGLSPEEFGATAEQNTAALPVRFWKINLDNVGPGFDWDQVLQQHNL